MNNRNWLIIGVVFAAIIMGTLSMKRAMPDEKNDRIFNEIKVYSPYVFEKRIGGLTILDKRDGRKEKPSAAEVHLRMDELNKKWGKTHLRVENSDLIIVGDNNQTIVKIFIETKEERAYLHNFYSL